MKKIAVLVAVAFISVCSCFADVFPNGEKILDSFWSKGQVIKIIEDENNIYYINKNSISSVAIDQDDFKFVISDFQIFNGQSAITQELSINKWSITLDEFNNIVVKKLPKQKK